MSGVREASSVLCAEDRRMDSLWTTATGNTGTVNSTEWTAVVTVNDLVRHRLRLFAPLLLSFSSDTRALRSISAEIVACTVAVLYVPHCALLPCTRPSCTTFRRPCCVVLCVRCSRTTSTLPWPALVEASVSAVIRRFSWIQRCCDDSSRLSTDQRCTASVDARHGSLHSPQQQRKAR